MFELFERFGSRSLRHSTNIEEALRCMHQDVILRIAQVIVVIKHGRFSRLERCVNLVEPDAQKDLAFADRVWVSAKVDERTRQRPTVAWIDNFYVNGQQSSVAQLRLN